MDTNYTPGPWRVDGLLIKAIDHGKWYGIAKAGGSKLTIEGNMANARLIAAAPELLAALLELVEKIDVDALPVSCTLARAAIAKAKGE